MLFSPLCTNSRRLLVLFALGLLLASFVHASPGSSATVQRSDTTAVAVPHRGIVWTPPEHPGPALREIDRMHRWGATAVRLTRFPPTDTIYARADSLGMVLYIDLPVSHVGARTMADTLRGVRPLLERLHAHARQHSSIQFVGLAHYVDTTVPAACSTLAGWTKRIHRMDPPLKTYYVTPFRSSTDACTTSVDRPLIALSGRSEPIERWQRWNDHIESAGIGALGTWMEPTARRGLEVPHSAEHQARHLETALSRLRSTSPPPALFVYRWSDRDESLLPWRKYGLIDSAGTARPSARVVQGMYTGRQRVFAFDSGDAPTSQPVGVILFGWALVALLGGLYARSPFFRQTSFRYFRAHGFYLDAVRQGRDVQTTTNVLLLLVAGGTLGIIITVGALILRQQPGMETGLAALPQSVQAPLVQALAQPSLAGSAAAVSALGLLGLWMALLTLTAQWTDRLSMGQALMLAVWPVWPVLFAGVLALVAATAPPIAVNVLALTLLLTLVGTAVSATVRVLRDYWTITQIPLPVVGVLLLPSPLALLIAGLTMLQVQYELPLLFLRHLLTRT